MSPLPRASRPLRGGRHPRPGLPAAAPVHLPGVATGWWTSTSCHSRRDWHAGSSASGAGITWTSGAFLEERGIAASRVVMLTGARTLGYVFNPITVFWCFDETGAQCAVVAEVHNTYGGRHAYVLEPDARG